MKVFDIIAENNDIDEAPMGMMKRAGLGLRSKLPGGGNARAKLDVGKDANSMAAELKRWMAGSGLKAISKDDFKDFLGQKGLPNNFIDTELTGIRTSKGLDPNAPMSKKEVDQFLKRASQMGFKQGGAASGAKSRYAQEPAPMMPPLGRGRRNPNP